MSKPQTPNSTIEPEVKPQSSTTTANIIGSLKLGALMTVGTAPFIDIFNRLSVASSRTNQTGRQLFNTVYSGKLNFQRPNVPTYKNFFAGLSPHLVKELSRLGFKAPGLGVYMPWLQANFSAHYATQIYAITMSAAEIIINPIDTWRVVRQSGDKLVISNLYEGAMLNGIRQYGVWTTVGYNNMLFDPVMRNYEIDPYGPLGIAIKAYPQAAINIFTVYPIERIKNELQFGTLPKGSGVREAASTIYKNYGIRGFFRGSLIKTPGGAIQHAAALSVLAWGKRQIDKPQQEKEAPPLSTFTTGMKK